MFADGYSAVVVVVVVIHLSLSFPLLFFTTYPVSLFPFLVIFDLFVPPTMSFARSAAPVRSALRTAAVHQHAQRSFTTANASGISTAAADDGALTSTVTVAVKAGSRYEPAPGVAHVLKNYLFKSNQKRSALRLVREAEFYGGVLSTALPRSTFCLPPSSCVATRTFSSRCLVTF